MKIVVTGNMGYVGPSLVKTLRRNHPAAELVGIDMGYFGHCLTGAQRLPESALDCQIIGDVRVAKAEWLEGADAVVHLAAISNDPMGKAFEEVTAQINFESSVELALLARSAGAKSYVFASSCSVYGYAEGAARDESSELNPLTAYAKSKINTEIAVEELASDSFTVTCLRFPTACGMSERVRLDLVLNDFVASAVATGRIEILSDGTPWRPLIDTQDMARAMDWAIQRDGSNGGRFLAVNVGRSEWNYQVKDLAAAVQVVMPGVDVSINPDAAPDKRSYRVDFSKYAELAPDHLPQVALEQSITELRAGLERMGFRDKEFRASDFMRLRVLSGHREQGRLDASLLWNSA